MHARLLVLALAATTALSIAQDLPRGQIVDTVKCAADPSQTYVLYLPSNYTPAKRRNLILAFDPGGRGRRPVERYQAAAEKYGYILAGSNNSRNGPWDISRAAAQAMWTDVLRRFNIDPRRIYAAGHSGGARVAMSIAVDYGHEVKYPGKIAGVFASSAFYPDDQPLTSLAFPIFGTAGTEDFNNLEMHRFDQAVTTPHRLEIFEGPHTWLPESLAMRAVEWMELQAIKSGLRSRDEAWVRQLFTTLESDASAQKDPVAQDHALAALAADFKGLRDVSAVLTRDAALRKQPVVQEALKAVRSEQQTEAETLSSIANLELGLADDSEVHAESLRGLRQRLTTLSAQAKAAQDSPTRRLARRVLAGVAAGSRGIDDREYQELVDSVRLPQPPQR
jgi:pimeloyl-ACP methyl ester carboxylesterase